MLQLNVYVWIPTCIADTYFVLVVYDSRLTPTTLFINSSLRVTILFILWTICFSNSFIPTVSIITSITTTNIIFITITIITINTTNTISIITTIMALVVVLLSRFLNSSFFTLVCILAWRLICISFDYFLFHIFSYLSLYSYLNS